MACVIAEPRSDACDRACGDECPVDAICEEGDVPVNGHPGCARFRIPRAQLPDGVGARAAAQARSPVGRA